MRLDVCCALCAVSSAQGCVRSPAAECLLATDGQAHNKHATGAMHGIHALKTQCSSRMVPGFVPVYEVPVAAAVGAAEELQSTGVLLKRGELE